MARSQSREIHVTYEEYKRLVPLENDTYEAFLDGFINTFRDVFPVSEEKAREMVLLQKYNLDFEDYVDIKSGESLAGVIKVKATLIGPSGRGSSYPLRDNYIYNLWSLGSYQGNGFLRRINDRTLAADGNGITADCEWLAHQMSRPRAIYWKFSNLDNSKVLAINNGQVVLEDPGKAGGSSYFLPGLNGRYQSFSPRGTQGAFLGADGAGNVKVIPNKEPMRRRGMLYNPTPQTLFIPYFLRKK